MISYFGSLYVTVIKFFPITNNHSTTKGGYISMNNYLSNFDWESVFSHHNLASNWTLLKDKTLDPTIQFIPLCSSKKT